MLAWPKSTRIHFVGIGGIGMSGIAEVLLDLGYSISGSDLNQSSVTENLIKKGATIFSGHSAAHVQSAQLVIYSSAINEQNPEFSQAVALKTPMMKRGQLLAEMMKCYTGVAIAGSHGKTTTSSMVATIFRAAKLDPSFIIGGLITNLGGNAYSGTGRHLVVESDESDGSFLFMTPSLIALTNIDDDHIDHYGSKEKIVEAFRQFVDKLPDYGQVVLNQDDECCRKLKLRASIKAAWYSSETKDADYFASQIRYAADGTSFDLFYQGQPVVKIKSHLLGRHNVANTLAAIGISHQAGISWNDISLGVNQFLGVSRRLEKLYEKNSFVVIDDYGHHPTEVKATLAAIKEVDQRSLYVVFEPHRFTRTQNFWNEFKQAFSLADELFIAPIYAASEAAIEGVSSLKLVEEMQSTGKKVSHLNSLAEMQELLKTRVNTPGVFLTLGAGGISKKIRELVKSL